MYQLNNSYNNFNLSLIFEKIKESNLANWRELIKNKHLFLNLLNLLIDHEEANKTEKNTPDFYLRKAISVAEADDVRIYLRDLGGYLFHIVAELKIVSIFTATSWLHEDGIQMEREKSSTDVNNKAHKIICLTDMFINNTQILDLSNQIVMPSDGAVNLMLIDVK